MKTKTYYSNISGLLEISYQNGKKILNSRNVNYSYGALQRVLHEGLRQISFGPQFKNILVLGAGGGSIVETVRDDFGSKALVTLVEIDPEVIKLAKEEFDLLSYPEVALVEADAAAFARDTTQSFELVIVDLFIHDKIPAVFTEEDFLNNLTQLIPVEGSLIYNTMRTSLRREVRNRMVDVLEKGGMNINILENVGSFNDLIIGIKKEKKRDFRKDELVL